MTHNEYENLKPREAVSTAESRLFSFSRIRAGEVRRFFPGSSAKIHIANRDVDTLTIPGVPSGYLAPGDVVTASYRGKTVFRGDVSQIVESMSRGTDKTQTVMCVGPWSKMQRLVYRQEWFTGGGYSYSSRLILNQTKSGRPQNLNSELYEIAAHGANACGYDVNIADIAVSSQILPMDECRDITVADAIKRELRFFPKAMCYFDYSGDKPSLVIKKPTSAVSASYVDTIPKSAREYVYNAHPITGVDLEIEATGSIEGVNYHQIAHQTAGDTTAGNLDCLYATLQIKGANAQSTHQTFRSVTEDIPEDLNDISWWKERHPRLANAASDYIYISDAKRTPANYPRISAATAGELKEAGLHCEVSTFTCKCTIKTEDDVEEDIFLTLQYLTTNASGTKEEPKTYTWVTDSSAEGGESVPEGLAATILAERSGRLLSEKLSIRLGETLPVLGDAIVEDEGTVYLQSFDVDCANLTAELSFGVPEYLSPEDMASLLSGFRNKRTTSSSSIRSSGKPPSKSTVEMGAIPPLSSSEFAPGQKVKTVIGGKNGGKIKLDAEGLKPGEEVTLRDVKTKDGKTVKVLSSGEIDGLGGAGVSTLNLADGDVNIVGGLDISVETHNKTIVITYKNGKPSDYNPSSGSSHDPCAHDPSGNQGGVSPSDEKKDKGESSNASVGGIPAIDPFIPHIGDNNCNTNC